MSRIEINLLPRELRGKRRGISFDKSLTLIAAFVGILVVLIAGVSVLQGIQLKALDKNIADAHVRANQLQKDIELVDALTQLKSKILQRMSAIDALDRNRSVWVRMLEDLCQRIPDYLWLSLLMEEESQSEATSDTSTDSTISFAQLEPPVKKMTIEGYSYSLNSLASFLIQLMGSQYLKNMELQYVKRAEVKGYKTFSFQLVGGLYYVPEFENPDADTAVHELALINQKKNPEVDLVAGRE
jgi:Tfp pilus assembly protein PilN